MENKKERENVVSIVNNENNSLNQNTNFLSLNIELFLVINNLTIHHNLSLKIL